MLKALLKKLGEGIVIGIGFGIVFGVFSYVQTRMAISEMKDDVFSGLHDFGPDAKLSITSHRPKPGHEKSNFLGEISNDGSKAWTYVQVVVELFDGSGAFVGKCSDRLDGVIRPGEKRNFEVACSSCGNETVSDFDRYSMQIVDASPQQ